MHSKIYQIARKPIGVENYVGSDKFYDNSSDFADYIGDEMVGDDRRDCIGSLASSLADLFDLDAEHDALVFKGKAALGTFRRKWVERIHAEAAKITTLNVLSGHLRFELEEVCNQTHKRLESRFYIVGWNDYAAPLEDLIQFVAHENMIKGSRLYIGAVIDFHY